MELVGTAPDFEWFDAELGELSYVLIGRRGHEPTLFPEVFSSDSELSPEVAMRLYGSWQHVEDIEAIREDMLAKGLLPPDGTIMLFGASGAGFLAQQFLHGYGAHVSRAVIQVSGAPDIARSEDTPFSQALHDFDEQSAEMLRELLGRSPADRAAIAYTLFQLCRQSRTPQKAMREAITTMKEGGWWTAKLETNRPSRNLALAKLLLSSPASAAAQVRMFELLGADIAKYQPGQSPINLVYEWAPEVLSSFVEAQRTGDLAPPDFVIERRLYDGEVLVLAGANDVVFAPRMSQALAKSYPNGYLVVVDEGHRFKDVDGYARHLRRAFFDHGAESQEFVSLLADPHNTNRSSSEKEIGQERSPGPRL